MSAEGFDTEKTDAKTPVKGASVWRRWAALSRSERSLVVDVLRQTVIVAIQLRTRGFQHARKSLDAFDHAGVGSLPVSPVRLARFVAIAANLMPWRINCLERSLILVRLLRKRGVQPVIRLGVRRHEETLEFHAWTELDDKVLNDRADVGQVFAPFGSADPPSNATFV